MCGGDNHYTKHKQISNTKNINDPNTTQIAVKSSIFPTRGVQQVAEVRARGGLRMNKIGKQFIQLLGRVLCVKGHFQRSRLGSRAEAAGHGEWDCDDVRTHAGLAGGGEVAGHHLGIQRGGQVALVGEEGQ